MAEVPLVALIEEKFSNPSELLVILLLDSSGSVGPQYEDLRQLALVLVQKMPGIMVQLMQFSATVEVVCPFTTNTSLLEGAVRGMKHLNGSTNMNDAFREVKTCLLRTVTEESRPVIFFITDGQYSGKNPEAEIQELLKSVSCSM
jgi:Mg-chelatase subunit ChlD